MSLDIIINVVGVLAFSLQKFPIPPTELIHRTRLHRTMPTARTGPPTGLIARTASWMPLTTTKSNGIGRRNELQQRIIQCSRANSNNSITVLNFNLSDSCLASLQTFLLSLSSTKYVSLFCIIFKWFPNQTFILSVNCFALPLFSDHPPVLLVSDPT